jgi:PTH1 family peptidyl-tRNA hydrolase
MCLDVLAQRQAIHLAPSREFRSEAGRKGELTLAKPLTFVNRSGVAVNLLMQRLKIEPSDLLVIHDDLDLPLEKLRFKKGGSSAGHKGVESIIEALGTPEFLRLRLGVDRPPGDAVDYVLGEFLSYEKETVKEVVERATRAVEYMLAFGQDQAMNEYNR